MSGNTVDETANRSTLVLDEIRYEKRQIYGNRTKVSQHAT
jgi:hypothetical protein